MDPLRFAIAAAPVAAYLLLIGLVNLSRRPTLVTGAGDLATLGAALTGFAFVGPIALFRPDAATAELGNFVWLLLLSLYWLWVVLVVMLCRPRLVVYNLSAEELRPVIAEAVRGLDVGARWAGDSLSLPGLGVQAHFDSLPLLRNTSLIATGGRQDLAGWRRFTTAMNRALRNVEARRNPIAFVPLGSGAGLLLALTFRLAADPASVAVTLGEILAF